MAVKEVQSRALAIIAQAPEGIRLKELVRTIKQQSPETPENTIVGSVWNLHNLFPTQVSKPSRGLFVQVNSYRSGVAIDEEESQTSSSVVERDFYQPFADWLRRELDEVTNARALGGAGLKSKWGTPDVVGVYRPLTGDLIKFQPEIVSAEIKIDPSAPVVAFGQSAAYRLFSTKSYVVVPNTVTRDDLDRLEALALLFGIGVVTFDVDVDHPEFLVRVRAQRFVPDMFYVNEFAHRLRTLDRDAFDELFG